MRFDLNRAPVALLAVVAAIVITLALPESAAALMEYDTVQITHDTVAVIDVGDTLGSPGTGVPVSLYLQNFSDSIQGFTISVTLSRPDLMTFQSYTTIDTCYPCLDSACNLIDTVLCTLEVVPSTVQNTLIQYWDHHEARTLGGTNILLSGIADVDFNRLPLPILPFTSGVLIKVVAQVNCNILDTLTSRTVLLDANPLQTFMTDPKGKTIPENRITMADTSVVGIDSTVHLWIYRPEIKIINGSITVPFTSKGDLNHDGTYDVLDVVGMINIAFRGGTEPCPPGISDVNCDSATDILDVVLMINHAFRGGPQPGC